jgi:hypothetical protein
MTKNIWKMLSVTSYKENTNQNYDVILLLSILQVLLHKNSSHNWSGR